MASLYQQGSKIEVIVRKEENGATQQGNNEVDTEENAGNSNSTNNNIWGTTSNTRKKRIIKTNITHALAVARQVGNLILNYKLGGLGYEAGDQSYQDLVQRNFEIADDVLSIVSSAGMGALYGSWGGAPGAVVGAVLNTASTGVSIAMKYKNRERDYSVKQFKLNNEISYSRARAGINLTTGRLR